MQNLGGIIKLTTGLRILSDIVNVKNATVIFNYDTGIYSLIHYDTEIAQIKDNQVLKALKCSNTSTKAIYQLTDYLEIDRQEVKKHFKPFNKFVKYKTGNNIKQNLEELI